MSFQNPAFQVPRQAVQHMEGMWVKMWDPPTRSPSTPDKLRPTNCVPEVMAAAGFQATPGTSFTVQRDLLHGMKLPTWDSAKEITFYVFRDKDNPTAAGGNWPAATIRVPRGAIFHAETQGHGPPPHTIHWHGIEPTPMNDGVGHCSMEIGHYTYQWQPNFIGTYFYHCHRNTVQHFEFGLYGMLLIDPPDAFFSTLQNPDIPVGACRDGKKRTAANLAGFPQFPGFNSNPLTAPDPLGQYLTDPHAMTVPYDVEALWVLDDRDSVWSDLAPGARATYPAYGSIPGVDDNFHGNAGGGLGPNDFFAFNDFNADYWYVTGVPVPAHRGETAAIPPGIVIPAALNSGVEGQQVSIKAQTGETVLLRCLDAAYNCLEITFPVPVVVIAWDGRALGVPPYGYNEAYEVPAGTPIHTSTARRFDALIRSDVPVDSVATVKFIDTRGQVPGLPEDVVCTAQIPIQILAAPAGAVSGTVTDESGSPLPGVAVTMTGAATRIAVTDESGRYEFLRLPDGSYTLTAHRDGAVFTPASRNVSVAGAPVIGQDFAKTQAAGTATISGSVHDSLGGLPIECVQVNLVGPTSAVTLTDAFGNYRFDGLADGRYTVIVSDSVYQFGPRERTVTVAGASVSVQSFMGRAPSSGVYENPTWGQKVPNRGPGRGGPGGGGPGPG
ncbi:MAG: carboxypeptidase regulatory-like domain-containing protein [Chloroflexi bacterium]|nr:carboxypeptidase regulatory-like domain-containing protein [Chloroflexota bacterium]